MPYLDPVAGTAREGLNEGDAGVSDHGALTGLADDDHPQYAGVLVDPGNVWEPDTAVTEGYRIAELVQGELRVFEATGAGTTDANPTFLDFTINLMPLGVSNFGVNFQYLGIVGQVPWTNAPLVPYLSYDILNGLSIAGPKPTSEAETFFTLHPALADPGNVWEAETEVIESTYRIAVTIDGTLHVFESGAGTTDSVEPDWEINVIGDSTIDGTVTWSYLGIVGGPDTQRPVFMANSAGDADWYLDENNGSGFRFNNSIDGVLVPNGGKTQITTSGFKVYTPTESFEINFDPFFIRVDGLPTADPAIAGRLWIDVAAGRVLKVSAGA